MESFEQAPREVVPQIASDTETLAALKQQGVDPIICRLNDHEVAVYTKSEHVQGNMRAGKNWSSTDSDTDADGYAEWIYTRLSEDELAEHLVDPTIHQGSDE